MESIGVLLLELFFNFKSTYSSTQPTRNDAPFSFRAISKRDLDLPSQVFFISLQIDTRHPLVRPKILD